MSSPSLFVYLPQFGRSTRYAKLCVGLTEHNYVRQSSSVLSLVANTDNNLPTID